MVANLVKIFSVFTILFLSLTSVSYGYTYEEAWDMWQEAQLNETYATGDYNDQETFHDIVYDRWDYIYAAFEYFVPAQDRPAIYFQYLAPIMDHILAFHGCAADARDANNAGSLVLINLSYEFYFSDPDTNYQNAYIANVLFDQSRAHSTAQYNSMWYHNITAFQELYAFEAILDDYGWTSEWTPE